MCPYSRIATETRKVKRDYCQNWEISKPQRRDQQDTNDLNQEIGTKGEDGGQEANTEERKSNNNKMSEKVTRNHTCKTKV